jgi:hypothetical protein
MNRFTRKYSDKLQGVLSGFDRILLKGTLRPLSYVRGMMNFLYDREVLLKRFATYVQQVSTQVKEATAAEAMQLGRQIIYLQSGKTDKDMRAHRIAEQEGIREGLICLFRVVEPCVSYDIYRNREAKELELRKRVRKCLWVYHYWIDPQFGFMSARIQTWFPFDIYVCLNGREWCARQLDRAGVSYHREENCFLWVEDLQKAQRLLAAQPQKRWVRALQRVVRRLNPVHGRIFRGYPLEYYWTNYQSELATDLMFRRAEDLAEIYPLLVRGAMSNFCSPQVMRFLGKKPHGNYRGEVISDYCKRKEGVRVKHRMGKNSVKMYDKQGRLLRVETTMNDPTPFKVFRPLEGNPQGEKEWRPLVRGIANMGRLAKVAQASNDRYMDALASLDTDTPIAKLVEGVCQPVEWGGRRVRALRPWEERDEKLFEAISRGEYVVNGFRNRDLVSQLYPEVEGLSKEERKRYAARVTRKLRMLRAHGIIRKVQGTHRYVMTKKGRDIVTAIQQYREVTLAQLQKAIA